MANMGYVKVTSKEVASSYALFSGASKYIQKKRHVHQERVASLNI